MTFEPTPTLTINDETIHGINIIARLFELKDNSPEAYDMFVQASNAFQRSHIPRFNYRLESKLAIAPKKDITDVGFDLSIVAVHSQPTSLTTMFETFVSLEIPLGYYVELMPRSSLSKTGYMLANGVGVIDNGYTGTIKVPLIKVDPTTPLIELPARVCQLVLKPYIVSIAHDVSGTEKNYTKRGSGGFGSTDKTN